VQIDWDENENYPQLSPCGSSCTSCGKRVLITAPLLVALGGAFSSAIAAAATAFIVGLRWRVARIGTAASTATSGAPTASATKKTHGFSNQIWHQQKQHFSRCALIGMKSLLISHLVVSLVPPDAKGYSSPRPSLWPFVVASPLPLQ
jgi:hypothetical protein